MVNRSAWTGGNLWSGLGWNPVFGTELNSLVNGNSVLSTVPISNGTGVDQFLDLSCICTIASSAVVAGAGVSLWLAMLLHDGASVGDGRMTAGASVTYTPPWFSAGFIPVQAGTTTLVVGGLPGLIIPPGTFSLIAQNLVGFNFAASGNAIQARSSNQDLNH